MPLPTEDSLKIGLLIPEFPGQTHVSWWRVGQAIRREGISVQMLSTRRSPDADKPVHNFLYAESQQTFYAWPVSAGRVLRRLLASPKGAWQALMYLAQLPESTWAEKLKLLPVWLSAANLCDFAITQDLQHIFVHSCANAAHLVALCHRMGGPAYSLRLGGDLEVYGKDHSAKMAKASFIASASETYLDKLVHEVGVSEDRVFWTWVGVDTRTFTPSPAKPIAQASSEGPFRLATVARLNEFKGYQYVIEALHQIKQQGLDVVYTVAGTGPYRPAIEALIEKLGLQSSVTLVGALGQQQVVDLLRQSDAFVLASFAKGEASPAVVSEAMACGLPVVCTRIGSTHLMIEDQVDGFLVPQADASAITAALSELIRSPEIRNRIGAAALAKSKTFDTQAVAQKLLARMFPEKFPQLLMSTKRHRIVSTPVTKTET